MAWSGLFVTVPLPKLSIVRVYSSCVKLAVDGGVAVDRYCFQPVALATNYRRLQPGSGVAVRVTTIPIVIRAIVDLLVTVVPLSNRLDRQGVFILREDGGDGGIAVDGYFVHQPRSQTSYQRSSLDRR